MKYGVMKTEKFYILAFSVMRNFWLAGQHQHFGETYCCCLCPYIPPWTCRQCIPPKPC